MQSSYITSAQKAHQLPPPAGPELAFVGRSNSGKSSLLNALLGHTGLARTSSTPGRTQMVNFFAVETGTERLILADLPGYGFSATGRETRQHWEELIAAYLQRSAIRELLFLADIRRAADGLDDTDLALIKQLTKRKPAAPVTVVLTKADKISASAAKKTAMDVAKLLGQRKMAVAQVIPVSSLRKTGIEDLRLALFGRT